METRPNNELPSAEYYRRRRIVTILQDKIKLLEKENKGLRAMLGNGSSTPTETR